MVEQFIKTNAGAKRLVARVDAESRKVRIRPLASIWPAGGGLSVIKIDTEGMEEEILSDARALIEAERPPIVVECVAERADAIDALMRAMGYVFVARFCFTPTFFYRHASSFTPGG